MSEIFKIIFLPKGKIQRRNFLIGFALMLALCLLPLYALLILPKQFGQLFLGLSHIVSFYLLIVLILKRLRDIGWNSFLILVFLFFPIAILLLFFIKGKSNIQEDSIKEGGKNKDTFIIKRIDSKLSGALYKGGRSFENSFCGLYERIPVLSLTGLIIFSLFVGILWFPWVFLLIISLGSNGGSYDFFSSLVASLFPLLILLLVLFWIKYLNKVLRNRNKNKLGT